MLTAAAPVRQQPRAASMAVSPVLSVVLPARNEAAGIQTSVRTVDTFLAGLGLSYEIIVGDSGSDDGTGALASNLGLPQVRVVRVDEPGKGLILGHAMSRAHGSVIAFLDSDLEISVEQLGPAISAVLAGSDAAIGSKALNAEFAASRTRTRRVMTAVANRLIRLALGTRLSDHQAGMKVFRSEALLPVLPRVRSTGWLWDTELLATMCASGASIVEIPVTTTPSRPSRLISMRQIFSAGRELIEICTRVRLHRWSKSLRAVTRAGELLPAG